jgi:tetratricopeptide (TPR) repeat protein
MMKVRAEWLLIATTALLPLLSRPVHGQDSPDKNHQDKPKKDAPAKTGVAAAEDSKDQPIWDPQRAEKDIEVGQYYMKRGDVDAAIDRFEDAIIAKPGYALPYRHLGDAQEKKGLKRQAIQSYTKYLDLYPHAEDAAKIRKRIEKLWASVEKGKK